KQQYVTLKSTNAPFENTLKALLRSASTPLTFTKDKGVYFVRFGTLPADPAPTPMEARPQTLPNVTLDFKDTPIRAALEQIFRGAKVDFSIDPAVQGYVNLKVTDVPFENALKLILRSSPTPLTYSKEDGVYLVKPRSVTVSEPRPPVIALATEARPSNGYESIELTYADPVDLAGLLKITMIPIGTRFGLKVPGAAGIVAPGGSARGGQPTPPGVNGGSGSSGGTVIGSGGTGTNPGGSGIIGL
ncbi:MAG: hypothetical protein H8F28_04970, partial [Fibrella sp.]|nr:hypothetical protein [Armatimonadota bacterium]